MSEFLRKFPPGVRGIPVVGVIPFVGKYPERKFLKWSKKHGEIMSVQMGMSDWIILNSLESINEVSMKVNLLLKFIQFLIKLFCKLLFLNGCLKIPFIRCNYASINFL